MPMKGFNTMENVETNDPNEEFLSRGIEHLGFLELKLRDLRGFATLAHELIQNADDAIGATTITFDVREEALVVDNNGVFSDCGSVEKDACRWKQDPQKKHLCDFHRFRKIASADKRLEGGTTGAFGVGFTAVYQITDHPELISNNRHWILQEEKVEDKRIKICRACNTCKRSKLPGTRFILPWAINKDSIIRKALHAEIVTSDMKSEFLRELQKSLPVAMIFLKKITCIEIKRDGRLLKRLLRVSDQDNLIISDGNSRNDVRWTILEGDFREAAARLRDLNQGMIEEKRSDQIKIAVPDKLITNGLLCACLPTEQDTGLPFHINADFFTSSDRKKIIVANDFQSEWNRAAIKGASEILALSFGELPPICGHKYLWEIIVSIFGVSQEARKNEREEAFTSFWDNLYPVLRRTPVIFTESKSWVRPDEAFLLSSEDEEEAQSVFDMLNVEIIHRDIRSLIYRGRLRYSEDLKIRRMELDHLIESLKDNGFTERIDRKSLPDLLKTDAGLFLLYDEILLLLSRQQNKDKRRELEKDLQACAIVRGRDQAIWPPQKIFFADDQTISLFDTFGALLPFADDLGDQYGEILRLCLNFSCNIAINYLKLIFKKPNPPLMPRSLSPTLIEWFEARKAELLVSPQLKQDLMSIPIFPGSDGLYPLTDLALPGDFYDPIGFSNIVALELLGGRRDFLKDLGAQSLTLTVYVRNHVPRAFKNETLSPEKKRLLINLLSLELSKIKDDNHTLEVLHALPIVECSDQKYRQPLLVYFPEEIVQKVLGNTVFFVLLPDENRSAIAEFYEWLGVARRPRSGDIIKFLQRLVSEPPKEESIKVISEICRYFGERYKDDEEPDSTIEDLSEIRWLPAKSEREHWHRPGELFTVFRDYLFASQANFLDLPRSIQESAINFFKLIGIETEPTTELVIKHLLTTGSGK